MPNGHQEDTRPVWERVKDIQQTLSHCREENKDLRERVEQLEQENASLITTIRLMGEAPDEN